MSRMTTGSGQWSDLFIQDSPAHSNEGSGSAVVQDPPQEGQEAPEQEDPYAGMFIERDEREFQWGGRTVTGEQITRLSERTGMSPDTILQMGTTSGRAMSRLGRTLPGQMVMEVSAGAEGAVESVLDLASRAGILPERVSENVQRSRQQRREFLDLV